MTVPALGLGTFRLKDQVVIDSVRTALELGYRAIDTAQIYGNEAEVGQAIADSGVPRSELFLTSKIWTENLGADKLIPSLKESLSKLRTDYLDLTLIHWPSPKGAVPVAEFMGALVEAQKQGLTRHIGVSTLSFGDGQWINARSTWSVRSFSRLVRRLASSASRLNSVIHTLVVR